ncbi:DUF4861 family protein, partial [uncultured Rikenella sp.]
MKKLLPLLGALVLCLSCGGVKVKVANPLKLNRTDETVELDWKEVQKRLPGITPEDIVVIGPKGEQLPSQVL